MTATIERPSTAPLQLAADSAADLMKPNPVSIRGDATIGEAICLLTDKGFSAAPVIDGAGRPIGVISRSDIMTHDREKVEYLTPSLDFYDEGESITRRSGERPEGFQVVNVDKASVRDVMTPVVFSVTPQTAARRVVEDMLNLKVHRLFVVDGAGVLVGVVSATDILQHLR